jgi:4-hydroxybenzoate polyprenyltransferase
MLKTFQKSLDFLLFSNIFIAFGTVAQALVTYHLLGFSPSYIVLAFLFFSTLLTYNFSILIQRPKQHQASKYKRVRWIFSNYWLNVSFTFLAALLVFVLFFFLGFKSQILVSFLGVISIGYALPIFSANGKKFGLRSIPGLKLLLIALVWVLSSVWLPILELEFNTKLALTNADIFILILKRFLFVMAIAIPFDIRDIFQDKGYNLQTIATVFGERKALLACQLMLVSYLVLLFLFRDNGFNPDFFALATTIIISGWLIFKSKWEKNEYYYFLYLDGILILQYIMLLLFKFVF